MTEVEVQSALVEGILGKAWTTCAPSRIRDLPFPRGFWPDIARVAVHLALGLDVSFRPTMCLQGNSPAPLQSSGRKSPGKISAEEKAANTARLLASFKEQNNG